MQKKHQGENCSRRNGDRISFSICSKHSATCTPEKHSYQEGGSLSRVLYHLLYFFMTWLVIPVIFTGLIPGCTFPVKKLAEHHKKVDTRIDGPTCPMYPSCSAYGIEAIDQYGMYGLFLLIDRLFYREVGDLSRKYLIAPESLSRHSRYFNPIEDDAILKKRRPSLFQEDYSRE